MAKPENEIPKINPNDVERLIEKFEQDKLEERDKQMITSLLRTLLTLVSLLQEKKASIHRLKEMIFGKKSEKRKKAEAEKEESGSEFSKEENQQTPGTMKNEEQGVPENSDRAIKRGCGRTAASAYAGAKKVHCHHRDLAPGDKCPAERCQGRLWPVNRPHHLIQFTGNPTVTATHYQQDVLKCAFCEKEYEAPLPAGVKPQRWDDTADAAIVIQKVELATPFYRTAQMQRSCGIPLSASVQWERCKVVFEALKPVYKQMQQAAANGKIFYGDDTPVRIQELIEENKEKKEAERVGMHTTGVVVELYEGARIVLYDNSRKHAGEVLEELYEKRDASLPLPIQMGDGLSWNWCGEHKKIVCKCLAHARRKFYELRKIHPGACEYVLKQIGEIYRNEAGTGGMSDAERLHYHQAHSGPVMEELKQWMEKQMAEKNVEPNSGLGKAIGYFQTHLEGLTAWLCYEGAPLDNNPAEQILKPPVLIRKNSYGYKTSKGAEVIAVLLSVIHSCRLNGTNVWTYLVSVLRRSGEVSKSPQDFLPWIYKGDDTGTAEVRAA